MAQKKKKIIDLGGPVPEEKPELSDVLPPPPTPKDALSSPENDVSAPPPPDDEKNPLPPDDDNLPPPPEDEDDETVEPVTQSSNVATPAEVLEPDEDAGLPEAPDEVERPSTPHQEEDVEEPETESDPQEPETPDGKKPAKPKHDREKKEKRKKKDKKSVSKRIVIEPEFPIPPDYAVPEPVPPELGGVVPVSIKEQKKHKKKREKKVQGAYERGKKLHLPTVGLVFVKGILIIYFIYALVFFGYIPGNYLHFANLGMTLAFVVMLLGMVIKAVFKVRSKLKGDILYLVVIICVGFGVLYAVQYLADTQIIEQERADIISLSVAFATAFGALLRYTLDSLSGRK